MKKAHLTECRTAEGRRTVLLSRNAVIHKEAVPMESAAMLWQGLRFGMLLQLAVGPVCLMVLNAAGTLGFLPTMPLVASFTLVDAFYILLASSAR